MKNLYEPAAIVQPAESMKQLAAEINAEHALGEQGTRKSLEHYRRAGEKLVKAKAQCKHGHWLRWIKENLTVSKSQVHNYMALARNWTANFQFTGNLEEALRTLARAKEEEEKEFEVPADIQELLDSSDAMTSLARKLVEVSNAMLKTEKTKAWEVSGFKKRVHASDLLTAGRDIEGHAPAECCPDCKGVQGSKDADVCSTCRGKRFLTHSEAEALRGKK